ncbi:GNAT family N-acetyltransferase [Pseudoduganella sp. CY13W]|uniref:GNAT family N-acetyltransferase n=2 Tax=Duganella qianjiadongensis TaxID=2692176 RepID=A0ABW9VLB9_9BURK|nr:GNAT family N-acetyltransferase [Duganella qianjiadongensis]
MSAIRLAVRENMLSHPARITPQMYRDYLALLGRGWVAEFDGEIAGFSYADQADASIWALFIAPEHEGKGLGRALLQLATDWLFAQGHACLRLSTGAGTRAERFYAAQGWQREKQAGGDVYFCLPAQTGQAGLDGH